MSPTLSHSGPIAAIDNLHIVKCQLCSRSLLPSAFSTHFALCKQRYPDAFVKLDHSSTSSTSTSPSRTNNIKNTLQQLDIKLTSPSSIITSSNPSDISNNESTTPSTSQNDTSLLNSHTPTPSLLMSDLINSVPGTQSNCDDSPNPSSEIITTNNSSAIAPPKSTKKRKLPSKDTVTTNNNTTTSEKPTSTTKKSKSGTTPSSTPKLNRKSFELNLDTQCGVIDPKKGERCRRSITCKNHSIGQKRLVEGRSQPYDTLFDLFKGNQRLQQEANNRAATREESEDLPPLPECTEDEEGSELMEAMKRLTPTCVVGPIPRWQMARSLFNVVATVRIALQAAVTQQQQQQQLPGNSTTIHTFDSISTSTATKSIMDISTVQSVSDQFPSITTNTTSSVHPDNLNSSTVVP